MRQQGPAVRLRVGTQGHLALRVTPPRETGRMNTTQSLDHRTETLTVGFPLGVECDFRDTVTDPRDVIACPKPAMRHLVNIDDPASPLRLCDEHYDEFRDECPSEAHGTISPITYRVTEVASDAPNSAAENAGRRERVVAARSSLEAANLGAIELTSSGLGKHSGGRPYGPPAHSDRFSVQFEYGSVVVDVVSAEATVQ